MQYYLPSKSVMEMHEHAIYSQMLQMFPNIPQDIIWKHVQLYSSDVEKCAQMLNLQNVQYSGLQLTTVENRRNELNESSSVIPNHLTLNHEIIHDNNNDLILSNEYEENTEQTSYDSHSSYSASLVSPPITEEKYIFRNPDTVVKPINFNEPLILDIVPDDEGISHSWRPSNSDDMLCPNIFVPSPVTENSKLPSYQIPNCNLQQNHLEFHLDPKTIDIESGRFSMTAQMLYNYDLPDWRDSGKDIASYLYYQKSQMNAVKYEVIKAKMELSDINESVESLEKDLKEKIQSKNAQDIIDLNKEIERLRLDCQCLCSEIDEIDNNTEEPILLGDVGERFHAQNKSTVKNADTGVINVDHSSNSNEDTSTDIQDESNKWQCRNCTFANHPAINVCEMCQLPKSVTRRPSFLPTSSSSCYCHPRESTLPVHS